MSCVKDLIISAGIDALDAELLLGHCLEKPRSWLFSWPDHEIEPTVADEFLKLVSRRAAGEPLAYIVGRQAFWSLELLVTEHTLVPRSDTECLVQWALELELPDNSRVLDLGTGSGAIALALSKERPEWRVAASDVSDNALAVAVENAASLDLSNVEFLSSDWFQDLADRRWQLLVSNPPYIAEGDKHLQGDGLVHEPELALVSGPDGLTALRKLIAGASEHLEPGGTILLEHGHEQGDAVRELLRKAGFLGVTSRRDLGGNERVSGGHLPC